MSLYTITVWINMFSKNSCRIPLCLASVTVCVKLHNSELKKYILVYQTKHTGVPYHKLYGLQISGQYIIRFTVTILI